MAFPFKRFKHFPNISNPQMNFRWYFHTKSAAFRLRQPIFPQANIINWVQKFYIPKVMRACADILSMLWIWVCSVWYLQVLGFGLPWEVIHRRRRCKRLSSLSFCVLQPQDHRRNRSSTGLKLISIWFSVFCTFIFGWSSLPSPFDLTRRSTVSRKADPLRTHPAVAQNPFLWVTTTSLLILRLSRPPRAL